MDILSAIGWPVLDRIRLGSFAISPHGIGIAAGYLAGSWWMLREGRKRGINEDHVGSILVWALIGAILGARIFYVIGHASEFASFVEMLQIWKGGISLVGGIFGAIALAYPFMRKYGYRFLQVMDSAAIGLGFGIALGRIGDLIIGDHLGKPTDWAMAFRYRGGQLAGFACDAQQCSDILQGGRRMSITLDQATLTSPDGQILGQGIGVHQTALYDMVIALGLFLFLYWLNKKARREGVLIAAFGIWYGAGRVFTDFLRIDKTWFGLTGSQWAAITVIVLCIGMLIRFWRKPLPPGETVPADGSPSNEGEPSAHTDLPGEPEGEEPTTTFTPPAEPGTG